MSAPRLSALTRIFLLLGFVFLYAPMLILVIYSFNASDRVAVWGGFSVRWYGELIRDPQMLGAAWISLRIAFMTATAAVALGTLAAVVLTRLHRFRGRTAFSGLITAPLVMPEVITGLSLLLLFVSLGQWLGWPSQRGMLTIWIAHVTFSTAYVAVVVSSRLAEMDMSLEEAAMDLGAGRFKTFVTITLPIIAPALVAGWLLAFTLSLDDLVIASFVSGPSATTLPMVVFSSVRLGVSPQINALAAILIIAVAVAAFVGWLLMRRKERRYRRDAQLALQQGG
ncbi:MAG TPA: ABC transporter permease subunit [Spongiibacteraceae bacterium]|jgi:putrescine transport system permease protein|nr:ABC transporter permease subunit [Spongiibacteraceae bacterium]HUH38792.1 ABC transporter permease subunit [Spongiibacteraceae bacterium]